MWWCNTKTNFCWSQRETSIQLKSCIWKPRKPSVRFKKWYKVAGQGSQTRNWGFGAPWLGAPLCNSAICSRCGNKNTRPFEQPVDDGVRGKEYFCCNAPIEFYRYNDIPKLLLARKGRCGNGKCFYVLLTLYGIRDLLYYGYRRLKFFNFPKSMDSLQSIR